MFCVIDLSVESLRREHIISVAFYERDIDLMEVVDLLLLCFLIISKSISPSSVRVEDSSSSIIHRKVHLLHYLRRYAGQVMRSTLACYKDLEPIFSKRLLLLLIAPAHGTNWGASIDLAHLHLVSELICLCQIVRSRYQFIYSLVSSWVIQELQRLFKAYVGFLAGSVVISLINKRQSIALVVEVLGWFDDCIYHITLWEYVLAISLLPNM